MDHPPAKPRTKGPTSESYRTGRNPPRKLIGNFRAKLVESGVRVA